MTAPDSDNASESVEAEGCKLDPASLSSAGLGEGPRASGYFGSGWVAEKTDGEGAVGS